MPAPIYFVHDKLFVTFAINLFAYFFALVLIFSILILAKNGSVKNLLNLSTFSFSPFLKFALLISFLSLSGMPPFLGFFGKFFIFFDLILKGNYLFVLFFMIFNLGSLYFYLQNIRSVITTPTKKPLKFLFNKRQFPSGWGMLILMLVLILTFSFLFLEPIIIILSCQLG